MSRFTRKTKTKYIACPLIANPKAPTRAELGAGQPLSQDIAAVNGFTLTGSTQDTPDLDHRRAPQVAGDDKVDDSSFTFWDDDDSTDIREALAKDTELFIVYLPYGDVPGKRCEVWQATSLGVNDKVDLSTAAQYQVGFAIGLTVEQDAVVPPKS